MAATVGVNPSLTNVLRECQDASSAGGKFKTQSAAVSSLPRKRESIWENGGCWPLDSRVLGNDG